MIWIGIFDAGAGQAITPCSAQWIVWTNANVGHTFSEGREGIDPCLLATFIVGVAVVSIPIRLLAPMRLREVDRRDADLPQAAGTLSATGGGPHRLHGGQKQPDERADNSNDDQELYERKRTLAIAAARKWPRTIQPVELWQNMVRAVHWF